jgi:hypothetical protein
MIPRFEFTYGYSDGQDFYTDTVPAQDIQIAIYQFARKHPNVFPENIIKIEKTMRLRDPLGQLRENE